MQEVANFWIFFHVLYTIRSCAGTGGGGYYLRRGLSMGPYVSHIDLLLTHNRANLI